MTTTWRPALQPSAPTGAYPIADWVMHFTTPRNVTDRGFYEREDDIALPGDGELSEGADEFEVLVTQLCLSGLAPGFPHGHDCHYSPPQSIVAQSLEAVEFASRIKRGLSCCGVALLRSEMLVAGSVDEVIYSRPDLLFEELLSWDMRSGSGAYVDCLDDLGRQSRIGLLPFLAPVNKKFSRFEIFVDVVDQASFTQRLLTKFRIKSELYETHDPVRSHLLAISNDARHPEIKLDPSEPKSTFPLVVEGPITPMLGFSIDNDFAKPIEWCGQPERYRLLIKMPQIVGFQRGLAILRIAASELSSRLKLEITVACDAFQN